MKIRRLLSLLLAMVMCLSLLPLEATVSAAEAVTFTALEGTAGANDDEGYEKLLDGKKTADNGSKWGVNYFSGAYIVIEASKMIRLSGYTFITGNDNTTATGRNPRDWVLYGANDYDAAAKTATWTAIHTVTNDTTMQDVNYAAYSFPIADNAFPYRYYKLEITATRGDSFMQLSEMEFHWNNVTFSVIAGTDAGSAYYSQNYTHLMDGSAIGKWCLPHFSSGDYAIIKASSAVIVSDYTITTAQYSQVYRKRPPKSWVWYGCNDYNIEDGSGSWTEINRVTNDTTIDASQEMSTYAYV